MYLKNINAQQIEKYNEEDYKTEKNELRSLNSFIILKYIRTTVDIMYNLKLEEKLEKFKILRDAKDISNSTPMSLNYEEILQQFEEESRFHISVDQVVTIGGTTTKNLYGRSPKQIRRGRKY